MIKYSHIFGSIFLVYVLIFSGCSQTFYPGANPLGNNTESCDSSVSLARYHYLAAKRQFAQKDLAAAEISLKKALEQDPDSSFLQRNLVELYLASSQKDHAQKLARSLADKHPDNVDNLLLLLQLQEDYPEKQLQSLLTDILVLDPENREAYLRLGKLYMKQEDSPRAEELFLRMTQIFPKDYVAWFYLGETCLKNNHQDKAEKAFEKSISLSPKLLEPRFRLAELLRQKQGENLSGKLTKIYGQILSIDPKNQQAQMEMALLYVHQGETGKANEIFAALLPAMAGDPHLLMLAADHFISYARSGDGVILFSRLLKKYANDNNKDILHFFTGMLYEANKDVESALECYKAITPGLPQYKKVVLNIALLYQNMGQSKKAIDFLEERQKLHPENTDLILYLVSFYDNQGLLQKALDLAKTSVEKHPDSVSLLFKLGELYDKSNDMEQCITIMKQVIAMEPQNANALNYLGYTYAQMGEHLDEALSLVKRAIAIKPEDGYIMDSLGWVYFQQGNYKTAIEHLEKAVSMTKYEAIISDHLAQAYLKTNKKALAIKIYEKALAIAKAEKREKNVALLTKKIEALHRLKNPVP